MNSDSVQSLGINKVIGESQSPVINQANPVKINSDDRLTKSSDKENRTYPPFTRKQLDNLISQANQILTPNTTEVHYVLHKKLNKYYVQVEDTITHQVIREIPPKKFMDMYAAIAEKLGLIVNKRV